MSNESNSEKVDGQSGEPPPGKSKQFWNRAKKPLTICLKVYVVLFLIGTLMSFPAVRAMLYPIAGLTSQPSFSFRDYSPLFTTTEKPTFLADVSKFTNYEFNVYKIDEIHQLTGTPRRPLPEAIDDSDAATEYKKLFEQHNHYLGFKPVAKLSGAVSSYDINRSEVVTTLPEPLKPGEYLAVMGVPGQTQKGSETAFAHFLVTDLGAIIKQDGDKMVFSTVSLTTRKPWPAANLKVSFNDFSNLESSSEVSADSSGEEEPGSSPGSGVDGQDSALPPGNRTVTSYAALTATTDANGIATIKRPANLPIALWQKASVDATSADNRAYFGPKRRYNGQHEGPGSWDTNFDHYFGGQYRTFFETDRPIYRVGQTINFKGVVRKVTSNGIANALTGTAIQLSVSDPSGNSFKNLTLHTDSFGAFKGQLLASETTKTGAYQFQLMYPNAEAEGFTATVEQYRKPDFKIDVTPERQRFARGEKVRFNIQANYYFGAPLKDAKIKYHVNSFADGQSKERLKTSTTADGAFFAGWPVDQRFHPYGGESSFDKVGELLTDGTGKAVLEFEAPSEAPKFENPYSANYLDDTFNVSIEATDMSRKTFTAEGAVPISRGDFTLLVDAPRSIVQNGENIVANVKAVDYEKKPIKFQKVEVTLSRWEYEQKLFDPSGTSKRVIVAKAEGVTDDKGQTSVTFKPGKDFVSTNYYLNAEAVDSKKRVVGDVTSVVYTSSEHAWYYDRAQESEQYGIQLDKDVYKPGETVRAVIKAPVTRGKDAYLLATVEGASLRQHKQLKVTGPVSVVEFPMDNSYAPNAYIGASLIMDNHAPYSMEQLVKVSPVNNLVNVSISSDKPQYRPGDTIKYTVSAKNKQGTPVPNMQLCASVVDEGIFAVRETMKREGRFYGESPDIVTAIFKQIGNDVVTKFTFMEANQAESMRGKNMFDGVGLAIVHAPIIILFNLNPHVYSEMEEMSSRSSARMYGAPGRGGSANQSMATAESDGAVAGGAPGGGGARPAPPAVPAPRTRSNFLDAAAWYPSLVTGPAGTATFDVKLPDDLTTWRATVNGVTSKIEMGSASHSVLASQDFLARLTLPRFYTEFDETTITSLVHNLSPVQQSVNVSLTVTPNIQLLDPATATLKIAKDGVQRQSWSVKILKAGEAKVTLKAIGSTLADAEERKIPIDKFGYRVFFAKNGLLKDASGEKSFPVVIPPDALLETGRFDITTSASSIGPVLGSFENLIGYPYGCTEQTLSKLIPSVVAMRLHKNLGVEISDEMNKKFQKAYALAMPKLWKHQHEDGGWGWWIDDHSDAYMTAHVLEGYHLLQKAGMRVDENQITRGRNYLSSRISELSIAPWDRFSSEDHAKSVYVMSLYGDALDPVNRTWQLLNLSKMTPESLAYMTMAFKNVKDEAAAMKTYERLKELRNDSVEYSNWDHTKEMLGKLGVDPRWDYTYRFTGVETTALALRATVMMEPKNEELLENVTRWLVLEHDENGWDNTKTTSAVFLSLLEKELSQSPNRTTNFTARVETLNKLIKELTFKKTYERGEQSASVPLVSAPVSIKLKKNGPGWLYYNTLLQYDRPLKVGEQPILKSLPADLKINRELFRLIPEKKKDSIEITNRLEPLGNQPVKSGDVIMIRVTVDCPFVVPYVLLESALPSGGEVMQMPPPLTPDQKIDQIDESSWNWWTHQDVLDDKVAYFATSMPGGKSVFRTFVRMEMPGKFNINPVNMEAMYTDKVHARSAAHDITVVDQ
ncbi:MAG: MG2 domain-containing protein [Candidatus Melainabacteria bacterium]|nr:MG2 domain-containing protein [Candidatus Melainabacteria bacterium]